MLHQEEPGALAPLEFIFNPSNKPIRLEVIDDQVYFIAKDLCDILELKDTNSALRILDDDEKLTRQISGSGQKRKMWLVNESGMYALIIRSNMPIGRQLRKHITSVILPAIRRNGHYTPAAAPAFRLGDAADPLRDEQALTRLIYAAIDIAGNQQTLASYLSVSPSVLCDLRNRPGKISVKLTRHVVHGCNKVVSQGAVPVEEIKEINTREVMQMWFDIVKIENYELRTSLSGRIARILGREVEFADDLAVLREKGAGHE